MRTTKELLILLRDELPNRIDDEGMCSVIQFMKFDRLISYDEMKLLEYYLIKNDPKTKHLNTDYWWEEGDLAPRIKWLNKQIKRLKNENN